MSARGFAIPSAVFLLVVLGGLAAFIVSMSTTQHITAAQDVQGTRAYWAARAGIQWAAARIKAGAACTGGFELDGFAVAVACSASSYTEADGTKTIHAVSSTATSGGTPGGLGFIERRIDAQLEF